MSLRASLCAAAMFLASVVAASTCEAGDGASSAAIERPIGESIGESGRDSGRGTKVGAAKRDKRHARKSSRHRHGTAKRRSGRLRETNMPHGWSWPPSKQMRDEGKACLAQLDALGIGYEQAGSARKVTTPITLTAMELGGVKLTSTYRKGPFTMDCHLALGLGRFAETLYGLGVREVAFSRIYDYTQVRVNGTVKNALSRHALGIAIDMRYFVDENGRKAVVVDDYPLGDALLLAVEQALNDSGLFRTVLTPRNDPASHDDHFHVEVAVDYGKSTHTSSL